MAQRYEVLIVGGGVSGAALLYQLAKFTDITRIGLVEKYSTLASLNSHARSNSQTLHCGDIETNYTYEKAKKVTQAAQKVVTYATALPEPERVIRKHSKMVLGVGEKEVAFLRKRFETFKDLYPHLRLLEKEQIGEIEPNVVYVDGKARPEEIVALGSLDEYTEVDYGALTRSFAESARAVPGKTTDIHMETKVLQITRGESGFTLRTSKGEVHADCVVVCAGAHSLLLAQSMGYGMEFSTLPVAGSFYYTPTKLNGKVYTVQNDKLPFAAIHGDPDILVPGRTRFGPTALILPKLERYRSGTVWEFFKTLHLGSAVAKVHWDLIKDPDIRSFMIKNILFEIPGVRTRKFLKDAQKIVPSLKLEELEFAKGIGGIRPQIIDRNRKVLMLGEAKINPGNGIIFNMTPSPGATSCLGNAEGDAKLVADYLGRTVLG